jgi:hypothetical protein
VVSESPKDLSEVKQTWHNAKMRYKSLGNSLLDFIISPAQNIKALPSKNQDKYKKA